MNITRNIITVSVSYPSDIDGLLRVSQTEVKMSKDVPWSFICIKIPAKLTITDKVEDGQRIYTAQLVFNAVDNFRKFDRLVFRATTAAGKEILIGDKCRPYPVTNISVIHPDNITDNQLDEVTVTYKSAEFPPYIIYA